MTLLTATKVGHYFGGLCALTDFNLELRRGELMGIIGPNGAGKTTVFNLLTGVYRASEGSIRYRGVELVGLTPHQITVQRIARTFQNIRLFRDLSVLDNVRIAHYSQTRYSPLEALLHLGRYRREEERIIDHSRGLLAIFGLEHLAGETARNLPYGSQRRLEMARALAIAPELLLLDEPGGNRPTDGAHRLDSPAVSIDDPADRAPDAAGHGDLRAHQGAGFWRNPGGGNPGGNPERSVGHEGLSG